MIRSIEAKRLSRLEMSLYLFLKVIKVYVNFMNNSSPLFFPPVDLIINDIFPNHRDLIAAGFFWRSRDELMLLAIRHRKKMFTLSRGWLLNRKCFGLTCISLLPYESSSIFYLVDNKSLFFRCGQVVLL